MPTDLTETWEAYCRADRRGIRREYLDALETFLKALESSDTETRSAWVAEFVRLRFDENQDLPLRGPLLERAVFPYLVSEYNVGSAAAALILVDLRASSLGNHRCWRSADSPGNGVELMTEAYRRNPTCDEIRKKLVKRHMFYLSYTLHELPTGVLYGCDGADKEQCKELLEFVQEIRGLLTEEEGKAYKQTLSRAEFHYRMYREYLLLPDRHPNGYESFLAEQADSQTP